MTVFKNSYSFLKENQWITGINIDIEGESMFYRSNLLGPLPRVQQLIKDIKKTYSYIKVSNSSITDTNNFCIPEITPPPSGDCEPGNYNACDFKNFSNVDWIQFQCYDNNPSNNPSNNWETDFVNKMFLIGKSIVKIKRHVQKLFQY